MSTAFVVAAVVSLLAAAVGSLIRRGDADTVSATHV
jgi:hypothetical protein